MKHIVFISVLFAILFVSLYLYNRPIPFFRVEQFEGDLDMDEINKQTTPMEIDKINPISKRVRNELAEKIRSLSGSQTIADTPKKQSNKKVETPVRNDIDYSQYIHKSRLEDIEKEIKENIEKYYIPKDSVPDMSKYVLKTEIPTCPQIDMDKYIAKTKMPVCSPPVDLSKYMLKTEIPPCVVPGDDKTVFPVDKMIGVFRNPVEQGGKWKSPYHKN